MLRVLAVVVVALGAVAAAALAWLVLGYRALDSATDGGRVRLGTSVDAALAPGGSILDERQLTLIYVTDTAGQGLGFTVLRTDPDQRRSTTLSFASLLPVRTGEGPPIELAQAPRAGGPAAVLRAVTPLLGTAPNHVIAISLQGLRHLVDTLGGVAVTNPAPFQSAIGDRIFPAGRLVIGGGDVEAFSSGDDFVTASANQRRLMRAITGELADTGTLSDLPSVARSVGRPLTTDLGTRELIELAYVHARATSAQECGAARRGAPAIHSFVDGDASGRGCDPATLPDVGRVPDERTIAVAGISLLALVAAAIAVLARWAALLVVAGGRRLTRRVDVSRAPARPAAGGRTSRYLGRASEAVWAATDAVGSRARRRRPRLGPTRPLTARDRVFDAADAVADGVRVLAGGTVAAVRRARRNVADSALDAWDFVADRWDRRRR